jgi:tetratricopeptide (TPR) repeat protein
MRLTVPSSPLALFLLLTAPAVLVDCSRDAATQEANFMKRGKALLARKDYSRAILEFSNAAKAKPTDAEPHYQMGLANLAANHIPQAVASFRGATQLNPKHTGALLKLAELMVQSRYPKVLEDAEARLAAILKATPEDPDALSTLAIARWKLGKREEAEQELQLALEKFPAHLASAAAMAALKLSKGDLAGAEAVLKGAVGQAPKSAEAGIALANFYFLVRKQPEAEAEIARVLAMEPGNPQALGAMASLEESRQQYAEADATYRKLAALKDAAYAPAHAVFLLRRKRFDEAIAEFRKLAETAPHDRAARTRLIDAELVAGKVPDAERDLGAALKMNPKDTDALLQRSRIYLRSGRIEEAEKDLREVIGYQRDSADAHYGLSQVYAATGTDTERREELGEALRLRGDLIRVRVELGRALIAAGSAKTALEIMDAAPAFQKSAIETIVGRNWALLALERLDEAAAGIDAGLSQVNSGELVLQRTILKMLRKDYAAAATDAEALLKSDPGNARALQLLMQSYLAGKQAAAAEVRLRQAALQKPATAELQVVVGQWFEGFGKVADARTAFEAAETARPSYPPAEMALATLDQRERKWDAARGRLSRMVSVHPRISQAWMNLANVEYQTGNKAQARDYYQKVAELDRRNVVALNNYAYLRAESDPDDALKHAERALEIAPDSAAVLDTMGWIYYRKGLYGEAVTYLDRAMAREATPRRQFHLGMSLLKCGRTDAGNQNLSAAIKKDASLAETESDW